MSEAINAPRPRDLGFVQPAEWAPHEATWIAWPSAADLWLENLAAARDAWIRMAVAIRRGERLEVLVPDKNAEHEASFLLGMAVATRDAFQATVNQLAPRELENVRFHRVPFGDIWLRDTAPIFVKNAEGEVATARFAFNGWGGKYVLEHDDRVAARVAEAAGLRAFAADWVLEGGSVDVDGEGTCLTTRQCLLHANRNPKMDARAIERELGASLGVTKTIWLGDGLANDHTDGHVDNVARFVAPGVVLCMEARRADDPNRAALEAIARDLAASTDARGRKLEVVRIPSPGRVTDEDGKVVPASFANFYVANAAVVVPTYGSPWDDEAVAKIGALFPGRQALGVNARAILTGGGAFHCITQQQPRAGAAGAGSGS
jgi:agmatine deiminase